MHVSSGIIPMNVMGILLRKTSDQVMWRSDDETLVTSAMKGRGGKGRKGRKGKDSVILKAEAA
jgi:hypothetical protein